MSGGVNSNESTSRRAVTAPGRPLPSYPRSTTLWLDGPPESRGEAFDDFGGGAFLCLAESLPRVETHPLHVSRRLGGRPERARGVVHLGVGGGRTLVGPHEIVHEAAGPAPAEGPGDGRRGEAGIGQCRLVEGMGTTLGAPKECCPQLSLGRAGGQHGGDVVGTGETASSNERQVAAPTHLS